MDATLTVADPLKDVPPPATARIAMRVTAAAERSLRAGHPWLFEQAIVSQNRTGHSGDLAVIFDRKGRFLAIGLYDPGSAIRVRVLHHGAPTEVNDAWFLDTLATAAARRRSLFVADTNGYRVVHGVNDGLPGFVMDRYASTLVIKLYTPAWIPHLRQIVGGLGDATGMEIERVVLRLSRGVDSAGEALRGLVDGLLLAGEPLREPLTFLENGLHFEVDPVHGHKTGFYLDQRDNRARVERLARGRSVLNVFAYTGGFSLYAARGGAPHVISIDVSQPALAAAARNFALNRSVPAVRSARHESIAADAFQWLPAASDRPQRFDMVIIDPPAMAKRQSEIAQALAAYTRLIRSSLELLAPDGILVAASCSSRVGADEFFAAAHRAAEAGGRRLHEIERTGHAADHPIGFAEGAYLKCLFARVARA